ncbi:MAG: methanol oxidation system protein MoxJ [Proteobacteria bacterium]|nr:methanol oxidation system protein MoxJ [Pseudomonadota bacterium]
MKIFKYKRFLITVFVCLSPALSNVYAASEAMLRVCAAKDELPYSSYNKNGFENSVAKVLANTLNKKLEFVWSDRAAIFLINDLLKKGSCDVVIGVDEGDSRVLTSKPYYRSSYVFIYRKDRNLDINSWDSPDLQKLKKFAYTPGSPPEIMLRKIGKYEENFNYIMSLINFKSRRNSYSRYEPQKMVNEVASGNADLAILWGPEAARYVNTATVPLTMKVVDETATGIEGETIQHHYNQSIGVREGDTQLLEELNRAIDESQGEIIQILEKEGVPLIKFDEIAYENNK